MASGTIKIEQEYTLTPAVSYRNTPILSCSVLFGKICFFSVSMDFSGAVSGFSTIVTGLPAPRAMVTNVTGVNTYVTTTMVSCYIETDGKLGVRPGFAANQGLAVSGCYLL